MRDYRGFITDFYNVNFDQRDILKKIPITLAVSKNFYFYIPNGTLQNSSYFEYCATYPHFFMNDIKKIPY